MTAKRLVFVFALLVSHLSLLTCAHAQAQRPPINRISGLTGDTTITSPAEGESLRFNSVTGKWENGVDLTDTVITSSVKGVAVADFMNTTLSNAGGVVLNWANGLYPAVPLIDGSGNESIDVSGRKIYGTDGTTVIADFNSTGTFKLPQLTNTNASAFLKTDVSGNVGVAAVPNAGTIPATTNLLAGDGAGNAVDTGFVPWFGGGFKFEPIAPSATVAFGVRNTSGSGSGQISVGNDSGWGVDLLTFGSTNTPSVPLAAPLDAALRVNFGRLILAASGPIIGSNDDGTTERWRFGNGLAVGTTTDPGAGVVNVNTGYRIGNAAPSNHVAVGNGATYVDGSVPGKASVTSTVDQTATTETAHVVWTVPANSAAVGTTYRIAAWGTMDSGTSITFTPHIRWGGTAGTSLIATPVPSTGSGFTNREWEAEALVTIRSIGASGSATCKLTIKDKLNVSETIWANSGGTAVTIDTTANKDLDLTWALSATTGTPHVRTFGGTIEVVKP